jgi:hypothetical protein
MLLATPASTPRIVRANRRADPRVPADKLHWLEDVRLAYGMSVSLIDLSVRGAFFEVACRLRAGDPTQLELVAERERTVASGRILRSEVVGLESDSVRYRGALAFDAPLPWMGRLLSAAADQDLTFASADLYEPWSGWSEILLLFRHGRRLQGYTQAFHGSEATLDLWPSRAALPRDRQVVPLTLLRAIHVVRDFGGDGLALADEGEISRAFPHVEIAFKNGQVMRGTTPGCNPDRMGFWLFPRTRRDLIRVFALSSAVAEIRIF